MGRSKLTKSGRMQLCTSLKANLILAIKKIAFFRGLIDKTPTDTNMILEEAIEEYITKHREWWNYDE